MNRSATTTLAVAVMVALLAAAAVPAVHGRPQHHRRRRTRQLLQAAPTPTECPATPTTAATTAGGACLSSCKISEFPSSATPLPPATISVASCAGSISSSNKASFCFNRPLTRVTLFIKDGNCNATGLGPGAGGAGCPFQPFPSTDRMNYLSCSNVQYGCKATFTRSGADATSTWSLLDGSATCTFRAGQSWAGARTFGCLRIVSSNDDKCITVSPGLCKPTAVNGGTIDSISAVVPTAIGECCRCKLTWPTPLVGTTSKCLGDSVPASIAVTQACPGWYPAGTVGFPAAVPTSLQAGADDSADLTTCAGRKVTWSVANSCAGSTAEARDATFTVAGGPLKWYSDAAATTVYSAPSEEQCVNNYASPDLYYKRQCDAVSASPVSATVTGTACSPIYTYSVPDAELTAITSLCPLAAPTKVIDTVTLNDPITYEMSGCKATYQRCSMAKSAPIDPDHTFDVGTCTTTLTYSTTDTDGCGEPITLPSKEYLLPGTCTAP